METITIVILVSAVGTFLLLLMMLGMHLRRRVEGFYQFADPDTSTCFNRAFAFEIPSFLTADQCDALMESAMRKGMDESQVGETKSSLDLNVRNSTQTWMKPTDDTVARAIRDKVTDMISSDARVAKCFKKLGNRYDFEDIQIVRYGLNGKYDPHFDATECGNDIGIPCARNQRIATVLIYLNDGFDGGFTRFPNLDMSVKPKKGSAVFFWVSDATANTPFVYEETLHGGDPVTNGEKWIATQWIRASQAA
jgi:prolyl 4-hydroxylase